MEGNKNKIASINENEDIVFKDYLAQKLCSETWGIDGHFTYADAAKVTAIGVVRESDNPYYGSIQVFDEDEFDRRPPLTSLTELKYFTNLKYIGCYAFAGCDELLEISFPESLEEIREYAFVFCKKLNELYIPDSVKKIDRRAFACCDALRKVSIPAGVHYGIDVFGYSSPELFVSERGTHTYAESDDVSFADPVTQEVCAMRWGHDGHFTFADALKVTEMGEHRYAENPYNETFFVFDEIEAKDRAQITTFDELKYFKNLKKLTVIAFRNVSNYVLLSCPRVRRISGIWYLLFVEICGKYISPTP